MQDVQGKKVFVGLSGGVDSAVTAALLKERGAQVTGVFIKGWYPPGMPCTWATDRRDAMRVAARLHIPFLTFDAAVEYKEGVIDYMVREYGAGRTPNPDIMCNREVKFKAFAQFAFEKGAEYIATGHYARTIDGVLYRGLDREKDQSYFLWAVPREVLQKTLFPLGNLKKTETRTLAHKFQLPNAQKKDSQGVCFLGSISMEDFLRSQFGEAEGIATTSEGIVVGQHSGTLLHTLGSRIHLKNAPPGPWYVLQKKLKDNVLIVGRERSSTSTSAVVLDEVNYFKEVPTGPIQAQFRYHGPVLSGTFTQDTRTFTPTELATEPLTEGQSLVLYDGDCCIGGGIIR
ncbi:tRNA 2-thiouridine(34) synthase MnmA [Patescibacteria group bacterium]|nr:tRNA 2-thiouridine(34) synthase MnmA [Patescibacteria group bacterium]MBU1500907.1 tRNA 2-thiouridine(34) synthase MnmA [Patescibacteria group bacterium]MBU2080962.1 tRNA 2-thiouridine(34) synthase MnmA [Patescibacteria group bacterium]MBU2124067.1 tRNA 2-thiouridine(34) synthase MnmA [Patescibacteria group bacterium]MBU2194642.1 tRNA 2-thiouridine(34) synthase MnmA [Patescibacteria group bacterium]